MTGSMLVARAVALARQAPGRALILAVYIIVLGVLVVPACITVLMSEKMVALTIVLGLAVLVGSAVMLASAVAFTRFNLAWTIFWAWVFVFLGMAPAYQLAAGEFPWGAETDTANTQIAQVVVIVGCVAVALSRWLFHRLRRQSGRATEKVAWAGSTPLARIMTAGLLVQIALSVIFIFAMGGDLIGGKLAFREQLLIVAGYPGGGSLYFLATAGALAVPAIAIAARKSVGKVNVWLIVASAVAGFLVTNPLIGSRFLTGSFLIGVLAALLIGRVVLRGLPIGVVVLLVTVFPTLDLLRGDGTGATAIAISAPQSALLTFDFDAFEMLTRAVSVAGDLPAGSPSPLMLFVAPFLRWVPGLSKLVVGDVSGPTVAHATNMTYTNVSMPLWGEAYLIAGFVGVVIAFILLGLLLAKLDDGPVPSSGLALQSWMVAPVAALLIIILRGSLYEVLGYLLFVLVLWLVLAWVVRWQTKRRDVATVDLQGEPT